MPNATSVEQLDRRIKIRELWLKGIRSFSRLAKEVDCGIPTVKRDLVYLRKEVRRYQKKVDIELIRYEMDQQYLAQLVEIDEKIEKFLEPSTASKVMAEGIQKDTKVVKTQTESSGPPYNAIVGLIKLKTEIVTKRAELWGLVKTGTNIAVSAHSEIKGPLVIVQNENKPSLLPDSRF